MIASKTASIAAIEDEAAEAAEVANLMAARRSSVARNGCGTELERRMSKVSRRSHRSSVGAESINSFHQGLTMTTTTAEVRKKMTWGL